MQKNALKNEKGITLVTLVVTIIVLLILVGISITGITGNNGLTQKSADAKKSAEFKSEMNLIEVASNSARGKNRYGNISVENLQKELNISAGTNRTEVTEEVDENDRIGYKITFLDSKRYYFVYNEGEDAEILFIGTVEKDTSKGIIHANPRRKKVNINTSEKVKILLRVFSNIDNNKIKLSYGWSESSYKEPDSYIDVTVDGTGNDKTTDASYPNETGDWYLFVKARINNEEEMLKVFGKYSVVAENVSTSTQKYTVIYEKGENVLSIGARYDTTTGEIKLPSITAENGYEVNGWYENDEYVGDPGDTININRNLTLTAEAQDNEKPTVKIAREDYDTFSWEAKDKEKITGYIITKSETQPSKEDSGWKEDGILTSGTHDIDSASTYYVYVRDEKGNIGKASIDAYLVTREQEAGTTLITRVDGTSNETGTPVTEDIAVLNNTKIYVEASATDGYTDVTINAGTKDVTNPGIITIQKNTTISSHAKSKELILAFDANGGTGTMPNQTIVYGTATNLSANTFTKTGYTFTGWNTKADGSGTSYTDGQSILITKEDTPKLETLYAQWTANQYEITYDYNVNNYTYQNDSFIDTNYTINWDEDFEIDSVVNIPTLGQRYLIAGNFYTTSSTSKDISLEITTGNKLRVWINGEQRGASTATIAAGTDITFHFSWVSSTKKYTFTSTGTNSNVTVTGTYDVTGSANKTLRQGMKDHRESGAAYKTMTTKSLKITKKHKYSTSLSNLPSAATKTGYTLNGWFTSTTGGTKVSTSTTVPAENKTYYAQWTENSYTIVFNKNNPNATGTMTNMSMTYGTAKALTSNAFAVTTTGITSKQIFNGWNTKVDGSGTSYANEASVNNLTTTAGGIVTLYAQWVDANYEVSSPVTYTLKIKEAIETANSSATIKVLKSVTDNSTAIVNKTLTLNLNAKTLTRNDIINITYGAFTLNGSADGSSVGMLNYTNSANAAIYNSGTEASFTIQNKTHLKTIGVGIVADGNTTKDLIIKDSWINETGNKRAISIAKAKDLIIQSSWVYADYGDNPAIYVDVLANLRFWGYSRIGGGNKKASTTNSLITFTNASQSQVTNLKVADHSIVMSGPYNRETVLANRAINASISGEAEMYAQNGSCFTHWANGSSIYVNTSGWVYAKGYYVVDASGSGRTVTANFPRGTLVASSKNMVIQGTNTYSGTSPGGTHDHDFYIMTAYNSYTTKRFTGLYEYGNGFVKVGNSSTYRWRYLRYGSQYTGWQQINGSWYYFWKNSDSPQLDSNDTNTYGEGMMVRKWVKLSGKWYYLTPSDGNEDPTVGDHGKMVTGWKKIDGAWYYFNVSQNGFGGNEVPGEMICNGTYGIGNKYYTFNSAGVCTTVSGNQTP